MIRSAAPLRDSDEYCSRAEVNQALTLFPLGDRSAAHKYTYLARAMSALEPVSCSSNAAQGALSASIVLQQVVAVRGSGRGPRNRPHTELVVRTDHSASRIGKPARHRLRRFYMAYCRSPRPSNHKLLASMSTGPRGRPTTAVRLLQAISIKPQ